MSKPTFYITTPIYYPSDNLHIGHAFCTVMADTFARYKRMRGFDVMFMTGTDEHGQKIQRKAQEVGKSPQVYVDEIVEGIQKLWTLLNISNDGFIRTTDPNHKAIVQTIFKKLYDQGDIYKSEYEGLYCTPCEAFWTELQLKEGKCPDCGRAVEKSREESYFFRLSKYQDRLVSHLEENPEFISPQSRLNEMLNNFIKPGLEDLCVSRTSFSWGIPVTFDDKHVIYVWIDALSNYITALGYSTENDALYQKYWPADIHLVGKEIVRFHTIIWPIMLMALGLPLPKQVIGHGWLLIDGGKMSKSVGNVVDPVTLCTRYGVDAIRYFLLREVALGSDGSFNNESLITRINADLANDLGNLLSRTVAMVERYFAGSLPYARERGEFDEELRTLMGQTIDKYALSMDKMQFSVALSELWRLVSRANKYIDETMPWVLVKDETKKPRLAQVLFNLCEVLRLSAIMLIPAMPATSEKIFSQIAVASQQRTWDSLFTSPETFSVEKGEVIFPRIDLEKELALLEKEQIEKMACAQASIIKEPVTQTAQSSGAASKTKAETALTGIITYDDFMKTSLKVAQIVECVSVEKSDKLLKLSVDVGGEKRQVVSGIAQWYSPAQLIGKKVLLVSNLKPAKLRGVESQGMILAADNSANDVRVIFVDDDIASGSTVR